MATVKTPLWPGIVSLPATNAPQVLSIIGSDGPIDSLAFDQTTEEHCHFKFKANNYGSGNLTLRISWQAASTTTGTVIWGGKLKCITPNTDSQDVETKTYATASTQSDTHLGTTAKRDHEITLTLSNLDSIAAGDDVWIDFYRDITDTLAADARLLDLQAEYSDT